MNPPPATPVSLSLAAVDQPGVALYPEQSARFILTLRNLGASDVEALKLAGNNDYPVIFALQPDGRLIGEYNKSSLQERAGLDPETKEPGRPKSVVLGPGKDDKRVFDLWTFTEGFAPGRYLVQAEHALVPLGVPLRSGSVGFEIVDANVDSSAAGFTWIDQSQGVLAWLATRRNPAGGPLRLLIRASAAKGMESLLNGAVAAGEFPTGSTVAVSHAMRGPSRWARAWVAVASLGSLWLVRHHFGTVVLTREFKLPRMDRSTLVAGFPDLGRRALAMLAASTGSRHFLAGFLGDESEPSLITWEIGLAAAPSALAVVTGDDQSIVLVYVTDDGRKAELRRLRFSPEGKLLEGERVLRSTPHAVRAQSAVSILDRRPGFAVLEVDRERPNLLSFVRVELDGTVKTFETHTPNGWPNRPLKQVGVGQDAQGVIYLAAVDVDGAVFAGRMDRGVSLKADGRQGQFHHVHVVCHRAEASVCAFTTNGRLFISKL